MGHHASGVLFKSLTGSTNRISHRFVMGCFSSIEEHSCPHPSLILCSSSVCDLLLVFYFPEQTIVHFVYLLDVVCIGSEQTQLVRCIAWFVIHILQFRKKYFKNSLPAPSMLREPENRVNMINAVGERKYAFNNISKFH